MRYNLKYSQYNERSVLIEWPAIIDENILESILNFKNSIENLYIQPKVEVIHTYNSILVIYSSTIENVNTRFLELKTIFNDNLCPKNVETLSWQIPVCYDQEFGIDIEAYSKKKNLLVSEVIEHHSNPIYKVYFIGFLPGFLYLGGLDSKLYLDRKTTPILNVKKGSIAIGGQQTGIYPENSPGGWHIIGRTPVKMFNSLREPPCLINAGDHLKFKSISKSEFKVMERHIEQGTFQLKPYVLDA